MRARTGVGMGTAWYGIERHREGPVIAKEECLQGT